MEVYVDNMLMKKYPMLWSSLSPKWSIQSTLEVQCEAKPKKMHVQSGLREVLRISSHSAGYRRQPWSDICYPKHEIASCIKEVQVLNRCLAALNRFLSRSTDNYKPFIQALKKNGEFQMGRWMWGRVPRSQEVLDLSATYIQAHHQRNTIPLS